MNCFSLCYKSLWKQQSCRVTSYLCSQQLEIRHNSLKNVWTHVCCKTWKLFLDCELMSYSGKYYFCSLRKDTVVKRPSKFPCWIFRKRGGWVEKDMLYLLCGSNSIEFNVARLSAAAGLFWLLIVKSLSAREKRTIQWSNEGLRWEMLLIKDWKSFFQYEMWCAKISMISCNHTILVYLTHLICSFSCGFEWSWESPEEAGWSDLWHSQWWWTTLGIWGETFMSCGAENENTQWNEHGEYLDKTSLTPNTE